MRISLPMLALLVAGLAGCTSVNVRPVSPAEGLKRVCVEENHKVVVSAFLPIILDGFRRRGIATEVYSTTMPANCDARLRYTARQSWDVVTYLSHAELWLDRNGQELGYAQFHMRGKGGLAFTKFKSTAAKMSPVMNQLLGTHLAPPDETEGSSP